MMLRRHTYEEYRIDCCSNKRNVAYPECHEQNRASGTKHSRGAVNALERQRRYFRVSHASLSLVKTVSLSSGVKRQRQPFRFAWVYRRTATESHLATTSIKAVPPNKGVTI